MLLVFVLGACARIDAVRTNQVPLPPSATATATQFGYQVAWYESPFTQTVANVSELLDANGWDVEGAVGTRSPVWEFSARKEDAQLYGMVIDCAGTFALPDGGVAANCGSLAPAGTRAMVTIELS